jgi:hypothetical protein
MERGNLVGDFLEEKAGPGQRLPSIGPVRPIEIWFVDDWRDMAGYIESFNRWVNLKRQSGDVTFRHTARVQADGVESAWVKAQNNGALPWLQGLGVDTFITKARSAQVGDVFVDRQYKEVWMVAPDGWQQMDMPNW